jgi:chorismate dehydratase
VITPSQFRIGGVNYLNSRPLIDALAKSDACAELILDVPSRLANLLAEAALDVALAPTFEMFLHPEYVAVSNACIACRGPVLSVRLLFRRPPSEVRSLAIDEGSRTSAVLARVLLHDRYGIQPQLEPLPLDTAILETTADAVLLIGDRAMFSPRDGFVETWDLGEQWREQTGLPFVFAMWTARPNCDHAALAALLTTVRDNGVARISAIAVEAGGELGLAAERAETYLRENLHFCFGNEEAVGLRLFHERAAALGLAPRDWELSIHDLTFA